MSRALALLVNPTAGRGRAAHSAGLAATRLRLAGYDVRIEVGTDADDAARRARAAVAADDLLVACGGDGMVHLAVQALAGTGRPLGIIPAGTGNDVARYLDLPRTDPEAAADRIIASRTRTIDLARCGDRWFTTVLAAGFDAMVNERANAMNWPRGQMRYNLATMAELRTFRPLRYTLDIDGTAYSLDAMLVAVGNGPSFGGGLRITEPAVLDDGLLDVAIIGPVSKVDLVRSYPRLFTGTITDHPAYRHFRASRVTVASAGIVAYADGERFGALPLSVESVPGALTVFA
ncbi:YegS/Rv2252/BmrU family lipid kinase [Nocardioides sp. AE5]|uniref:diacylglycerol/lipid kinase family protein n=1 Tax=Nocardioides sp. AE5 TaxID=2962573 RepID=UPI0028827FAB|nr:YegS/Rv2252/BmrU family lipid kinase [Nocardioides sp. AE5]MDT0203554.1 YegS/Rv2252/BmrU family lipid kinase [Nocardioides sp. AE5]